MDRLNPLEKTFEKTLKKAHFIYECHVVLAQTESVLRCIFDAAT